MADNDEPKLQENKSPDDFDETDEVSRETQPEPIGQRNPAVDDFGDYGAEGGGGQPTTQHTGPGEEEEEKGEGLS